MIDIAIKNPPIFLVRTGEAFFSLKALTFEKLPTGLIVDYGFCFYTPNTAGAGHHRQEFTDCSGSYFPAPMRHLNEIPDLIDLLFEIRCIAASKPKEGSVL